MIQPRLTARDTYRAAACDGKISFATFTDAQLVAQRSSRRGRSRQIYHCPFCHLFHLGRRPAQPRQRRRETLDDDL